MRKEIQEGKWRQVRKCELGQVTLKSLILTV